MSKKLTLTLLGSVAISTLAVAPCASAADHISLHYMNFEEYDDKINAADNILSVEKNFGLNWTLNAELGYDSVSGASPSWGPTTLVSSNVDRIDRALKTRKAQAKSDAVIRAGYDPYRSGYAIQRYELEDTRYSGSLNLTYRDTLRNEWSIGLNYSQEDDYQSKGINAQALIYADSSKNRSYTFAGSLLFDNTLAFQKYSEFKNIQEWESVFKGEAEIGLSQVFTPHFYTTFTLYGGYKGGYLSNHYLTVLREVDINNNALIENDEIFLGQDTRPDARLFGGFSVRGFYYLNNYLSVQPSYKFFMDDWGVVAHQMGAKVNIKITSWLSIIPGYTWYNQQGANFYRDANASNNAFSDSGFASSDFRLGDFTANGYELGISLKVAKKWRLNALSAYYQQSNGYANQWWIIGATYEF